MVKLTETQQADVVKHVSSTFDDYKDQLSAYKTRMEEIYIATSTYKERPRAKRQTSFKVNKAFETENKVLPRVIANNPKRLVSVRTDEFTEGDNELSPEERAEKMKETSVYADAIRDYLTYVFNKHALEKVSKLRAKNSVRY